MNMKWYSWLHPHFRYLIKSYQIGRGHHALLIQALPGMGDAELIHAIVCFLMCQSPKGYKICGQCRDCQLMQSNTHPDYYVLELKKGEIALGIDVIREVIEKLRECSWLGSKKIVWLTNAALLTEAAANSLLKTLEEPTEGTWFFLSCREPARLLATIRSRCFLYRLSVPQELWSLAWLKHKAQTSEEKALTALRLCGGAPAAALELLKPVVSLRRERLCSSLRDAIESQQWLSLLTILNDNYVLENLYWLISLLLDALKIKCGISLITNIDSRILVNIISNRLSSVILRIVLYDMCRCRDQLITIAGIDHELVLANQLLRIEYFFKSDKIPLSPFL